MADELIEALLRPPVDRAVIGCEDDGERIEISVRLRDKLIDFIEQHTRIEPEAADRGVSEALERIEAIAITPGKWSGSAFDKIACLARDARGDLGER